MKVVAFNGSSRKDGNTAILLNLVLDELKNEGIETELIQLAREPLSGCMACYRCKENKDQRCAVVNDRVNEYIGKMQQAQGVLLGSPTYIAEMTANMKALIERSTIVSRNNGHLFRRKVGAAVIAVRRAGLHVRLRLPPTPPHGDAVTFGYQERASPERGLSPLQSHLLAGARIPASAGMTRLNARD